MDPDFLYAEMMRAIAEGRTVEAKAVAVALCIHLKLGGRYPEGVEEDAVDKSLADLRKPSKSRFILQTIGGSPLTSPPLTSVRPGRWWDASDSGPWRNPGDPEIDLAQVKHYMLRHRLVVDGRPTEADTIQACEEGMLVLDIASNDEALHREGYTLRSVCSLPIGSNPGPNLYTVFGDGLH